MTSNLVFPDLIKNNIGYYLWKFKIVQINMEYSSKFFDYTGYENDNYIKYQNPDDYDEYYTPSYYHIMYKLNNTNKPKFRYINNRTLDYFNTYDIFINNINTIKSSKDTTLSKYYYYSNGIYPPNILNRKNPRVLIYACIVCEIKCRAVDFHGISDYHNIDEYPTVQFIENNINEIDNISINHDIHINHYFNCNNCYESICDHHWKQSLEICQICRIDKNFYKRNTYIIIR
jgi:hypothetical protein